MTSFFKKTLLSYAVILSFGTYALWTSASESHASDSSSDTTLLTPTAPTPAPTTVLVAVPTGRFRDGSYTGTVADAYYGYIQVQAIIKGGKLVDIIFLQYPDDRGTSIEINRQAMPFLRQEAIAAQGTEIDGVTGATDSAVAFQESLSAALAQASTARTP